MTAAFPQVRVIIDGKEQRVNRPTGYEAQKPYYSGKKKAHTVKTQVVVDPCGRIEAVSDSVPGGANHDLPLLCGSGVLEQLAPGEAAMVDKGYVGLANYFPDVPAVIPFKASRGHPLTEEQEAYNREARVPPDRGRTPDGATEPVHGVASGVSGPATLAAWSRDPCGGEVGEPAAAGQAAEDLCRVRTRPASEAGNGPAVLRYNPNGLGRTGRSAGPRPEECAATFR